MMKPVDTKPRLVSKLLGPSERLQLCLRVPDRHVVPGSSGPHVGLIHQALIQLGAGVISPGEIKSQSYGPTTARAIKAFKGPPRNIINRTYQNAPDDIVGQMTIAQLDDEMEVLESILPSGSELVAFDDFGPPDHNHSLCPLPSFDPEIEKAADGTMSHVGSPMNPLGFGRKINIGGIREAVGFEDFVPDPQLDPGMRGVPIKGRGLTSSIRKHTVSDICFRSAPIDPFMKLEIKRICARRARLTCVQSTLTIIEQLFPYFRQIGVIEQQGFVPDPLPLSGPRVIDRPFVVVTVLNVNADADDPF